MEDFLADLDNELNGNDTGNNPVKKVEDDNGAKSVEIKKDFLRNNWKPSNQKKTIAPQTKKIPSSQPKWQRSQWRRTTSNWASEVKGKFISTFPETKFYLPSLREGYTRFIPIWGNNETGSKNMNMAQYNDDIVIIDCWVQFTDASLPGVNYSIPDVSFLTKYKKNIKYQEDILTTLI